MKAVRFGENTMNDGIEYKGIYSILVRIVSLSSSSLNWPRFLVIYLPLSGLDSSSHLRVPKTIRKIPTYLGTYLGNQLNFVVIRIVYHLSN